MHPSVKTLSLTQAQSVWGGGWGGGGGDLIPIDRGNDACSVSVFVFHSYKKRYWKKPYFDALDKLRETLDHIYGEGKVSLVDATLRWIYNHSWMDGAYGGMFFLSVVLLGLL